jgi:AcrR family transcriptional regulator
MLLAMSTDALPLDRRQRRRQETIEEVLDIAVEIMTEQGVAGLSIGEVARRMGIRPPSLYVYFASKEAMYDAVFLRGARAIFEHMREQTAGIETDTRPLPELMLSVARAMVRWSVEHPAFTQMLFWRPVPGFAPSDEAYAPAVELIQLSRSNFATLQRRGLFRRDVDTDLVLRDWTVLTAGVVSQQLSNAPHEPFDTGRFTSALPTLVAMFCDHYGSSPVPSATPSTRGGHRNARKR